MAHLSALTNLSKLDLNCTGVTDAGLAHLKGLTKLTLLDLGATNVSDSGLVHLNGLTNLSELNLSGTQVTDAGLVHLKGLIKLSRVWLINRRVTDAGVRELQNSSAEPERWSLICDGEKVAQLARTPARHARGQRFEFSRLAPSRHPAEQLAIRLAPLPNGSNVTQRRRHRNQVVTDHPAASPRRDGAGKYTYLIVRRMAAYWAVSDSCPDRRRRGRIPEGLPWLCAWSGVVALAQMRGDLPDVTPLVFDHTTTVPVRHVGWLFESTSTGIEGASIRRVNVVDVHVEKGGHRATNSGLANHDHRVADPYLGWKGFSVFSRSAENMLEEFYELTCVVSDDSWRNGVPAFRGEMGAAGCSFHRMIPWIKDRLPCCRND